jgi:PAS domain S-box-containing protein
VRLGEALAAALESFGLGVAVVDPDAMHFVFGSQPFADLLGITKADIARSPVAARFVAEDVAQAEAYLTLARTSRELKRLRLVHASGDPVAVELSARPFDDEKLSRCVAVVVRDVRQSAESAQSHVAHVGTDEAALTLQARDELFSIAAHELKTPLTSLRLHTAMMLRGLAREAPDLARARRSLDEIERHAERMTLLIEQLLDVARIQAGRLELERGPADLAVVIREVGARFGPEVASRGATIIIDGERSVVGRWDPLRLDQIVTNLVSNALKYGEGKPIVIELRSTSTHARLTVHDHGPGIPAEEQRRIFEPFERAGDSAEGGSGLGLWIVRRLAEAHGGEVSVASASGKGARFVVELPRGLRDER